MTKHQKILLYSLPFSALLLILLLSVNTKKENKLEKTTVILESKIKPMAVPDTFIFAGETVPLHFFDVRESLDRELQINAYWQSQTIYLIKRAGRFFPVIEAILKEEGVPDDFKYLAVAESGLSNVVSPSGAAGIWQFMKGAAKEYQLEINENVDERYHLEKSTRAACQYLKIAYQKFGTWTTAAASYNMGMNGMQRIIDNQNQTIYYDMHLLDETARYVYRIMAIKLVMENPLTFGFEISANEIYRPIAYNEVTVDSAITSLPAFAQKMNTNYKLLKIFNPWLRDVMLLNKTHKTYTLKIPKEGIRGQ